MISLLVLDTIVIGGGVSKHGGCSRVEISLAREGGSHSRRRGDSCPPLVKRCVGRADGSACPRALAAGPFFAHPMLGNIFLLEM